MAFIFHAISNVQQVDNISRELLIKLFLALDSRKQTRALILFDDVSLISLFSGSHFLINLSFGNMEEAEDRSRSPSKYKAVMTPEGMSKRTHFTADEVCSVLFNLHKQLKFK